MNVTSLYSSHESMFKSNPLYFLLLLVLIPVFGVGLIGFAIWYVKTRMTHLEVFPGNVVYTKGLFSRDRTEFAISGIRSVKVEQSFLERWTGAGTVRITTAGDQPEVTAKGMPDIALLQRLLKHV